MKLLPNEVKQLLPLMGTLSKTNKPEFYLRFFTNNGKWNWFVAEGEPLGNNDFRFYGFVMKDSSYWTTFTLSELEQLRDLQGYPVWRDGHFDQTTWREYLESCGMGNWCNTHGFTELAEAVNSFPEKGSIQHTVPDNEITIINIGDMVLCDYCNGDYTNSDECGGLLINNNAVCPQCITESRIAQAELICPPMIAFKEWVLALRNGNNTITIETFNT